MSSATKPPTIPSLYNSRALSYDTKTSFHRHLATEYIKYAQPIPGESLLDLACGTGLVTFSLASILHSQSSTSPILGIDISKGMLDIGRAKNQDENVVFVEHDITHLDTVKELQGTEGRWDIITICSALVLLDHPGEVLGMCVRYLRRGGRLVVDVPGVGSMLRIKVFEEIGAEFGVQVLGKRTWIEGVGSLSVLIERVGLKAEVFETEVFEDIPARTDGGKGVWEKSEAGSLFDEGLSPGRGGNEFSKLDEVEMEKARKRFVEEWGKLAGKDGLVREEGRLYVGIGRKN